MIKVKIIELLLIILTAMILTLCLLLVIHINSFASNRFVFSLFRKIVLSFT